jgi:hypothetical protein
VHSLLLKLHLVSRYTWKRNFIYAHKKRTALLSAVFTKLSHTRHNYVQIPYTEIHPNWGGGGCILRININVILKYVNIKINGYKFIHVVN